MRKVALFGATGSIGQSTLRVLRAHPQEFSLMAAVANTNVDAMLSLVREFKPRMVAMFNQKAALKLEEILKQEGLNTDVLAGEAGVESCALESGAELAVLAVVGAAGLKPALACASKGLTLALANKEALVMSGKLFFEVASAHHAKVLPVDSEHSAIFQSLPEKCQQEIGFCDLKAAGVHRILLTGSGGPFRDLPLESLSKVTAAQAINHPVWKMGPKISVDSSTMMNKGLEFIEARYLFNAKDSDIEVVIHPQSVVHSMVSYKDGAVLAQLGNPDMCTPIARALAYPDRIFSTVEPLDFFSLKELTFKEPDLRRYPCLKLAMQASLEGQGATTALNAANEVAVAAFLDGRIGYCDIASCVEQVLSKIDCGRVATLEDILAQDQEARILCTEVIKVIS